MSASDRPTLLELAPEVAEALASGADLRKLSHEVPQSTSRGLERLAVASADRAGLIEGFSFFADGIPSPRWTHARVTGESGPLTWCFGGHGGQWLGMGRDLLAGVPPAARVLKALDGLLPGGVIDPLTNSTAEGFDSPLIFAIQVAMASWLLGAGVEPSAVVGHSLGEVAAAHIAGALTLIEAATVVAVRSALLGRTAGQGAMATVGLDHHAVTRRIAEAGADVSVAAHSAPTETIVAGRRAGVQMLVEQLEADGVRCRLIRIDAASHSPLVDEALPKLRAELAGLTPRQPMRSWISTADRGDQPPKADAEYWVRNLRQPVLFTEAVSALAGRGTRILIEIGPHQVLASSIRATLRGAGLDDALVVSTGARQTPERVSLLGVLGALYCKGFDLDLTRILS